MSPEESLVQLVKSRILNAIEAISAEYKIVVLDPWTVKLVDSACTMHEILDVGVYRMHISISNFVIDCNSLVVETVDKRRQAYPNMDAIYLVSPTKATIEKVIADFRGKSHLYGGAHILSVAALQKSEFALLAASQAAAYVRTLSELYIDFVATESRIFQLAAPSSFALLYGDTANGQPANSDVLMNVLADLASQIVSVCVTLGELPWIRYQRADNDRISPKLAILVQEHLDNYASANPQFKPSSDSSTLLILGRTHDLISPLLHEFTYQAMACDLLPIADGNRYKYGFSTAGGSSEREVSLDENDSLWTLLRHTHIADSSTAIVGRYNTFLNENKAAVSSAMKKAGLSKGASTDKPSSLGEIRETMGALGEFQETKAQFSLHLNIAQECMAASERKDLMTVAVVEQLMATGLDNEGRPAKEKDVWNQLAPLLASSSLSSKDKTRLVMLYLLTNPKMSDADRRAMFDHARLSNEEHAAVRSILAMANDVPSIKPSASKKSKHPVKPMTDYDVSRFVPVIKQTVTDLIYNELDNNEYQLVKERRSSVTSTTGYSPSTAQPQSLRQKATATSKYPGTTPSASSAAASGKIIVFIAGGVSYSEIRSVYEIAEATGRQVYLGATHLATPELFLRDLQSLSQRN